MYYDEKIIKKTNKNSQQIDFKAWNLINIIVPLFL